MLNDTFSFCLVRELVVRSRTHLKEIFYSDIKFTNNYGNFFSFVVQ